MNIKEYKEINVKPNKLVSMFINIIAFIVAAIYVIIITTINVKAGNELYSINITKLIIYFLEFLSIIILHELIHKYTFKFYGKLDVSYMKINFKNLPMNLSVTLQDYTTVDILRTELIMPTFILFIVITIISLTSKDVFQSFFIALIICGGSSDISLFLELKKFDKKDIIKDNKNETGCKVYIK